jgi:predicted  nucleic acid-binding Zn-ribbon protein
MTRVKPYLFLKRLVVVSKEGGFSYDEPFHRGVNIIRGENSSGKSTLANFIFYSLGGDFNNWTDAALKCGEVFSESDMSETTLTLRRPISETSQQGLDIFWGNFADASKSPFEGWKHFPYRQSSKESFSNVLFSTLGIPEVRSQEDNKITMHQLLRLFYIDQDSPPQSLFRFERFDQPLTRLTTAELMLGAHDNSLLNDRLALRDADRKYAEKQHEFSAIKRVFGSTGHEIDVTKLQKELDRTKSKLSETDEEISKVRTARLTARRTTSPRIEKLNDELTSLKTQANRLISQIKQLELDIADSTEFIATLQKKRSALEESMLTRRALGELTLEYCPLCLTPLTENADEGQCTLCKQTLAGDPDKTFGRRIQQELSLQITESEKLLSEKRAKLTDLSSSFQPLIEQLNLSQREIDLEERQYSSTREQKWDDLLVTKGKLENQIDTVTRQIEASAQLEQLRRDLQELAKDIERLRQQVRIKEERQGSNWRNALAAVQRLALFILRRDLDYQPEFQTGNEVQIDFAKDTFSLDGKNNFSASSNIYLKNAIRFAIFFASLELPYMRYPRFILCDNTEDKGMQPERSQNFQKVIVELSTASQVDHQIILTTSMIERSLNDSTYCIGREYTKVDKSLRLNGAPSA